MDSFHPFEKLKQTDTSSSLHSQWRERTPERNSIHQRVDLVCVSKYKCHTTNNTAMYFYITITLSSHQNFIEKNHILHQGNEKRLIKHCLKSQLCNLDFRKICRPELLAGGLPCAGACLHVHMVSNILWEMNCLLRLDT